MSCAVQIPSEHAQRGARFQGSGNWFVAQTVFVIGVDDAKAVLKIADDVKVEFSKSSIVQVMATETK